jgi:hypothetical protein
MVNNCCVFPKQVKARSNGHKLNLAGVSLDIMYNVLVLFTRTWFEVPSIGKCGKQRKYARRMLLILFTNSKYIKEKNGITVGLKDIS